MCALTDWAEVVADSVEGVSGVSGDEVDLGKGALALHCNTAVHACSIWLWL